MNFHFENEKQRIFFENYILLKLTCRMCVIYLIVCALNTALSILLINLHQTFS